MARPRLARGSGLERELSGQVKECNLSPTNKQKRAWLKREGWMGGERLIMLAGMEEEMREWNECVSG